MLIHWNKQTPNQVVSIERKCLKSAHSILSTVIYLLEKINFLWLKLWSDIFNVWSDRSRTWSKIVWHFKIVKIFYFLWKRNNSWTRSQMNVKFPLSLYLIILQSLEFWCFFKKPYFVVTKENVLFCLIGF